MIDILFRGKRTDNGKWVTGYPWRGADHAHIIPSGVGIGYNNETQTLTAFAYDVIPESVGQYTGKRDKNGKPIFGGSLIKYFYLDPNSDAFNHTGQGVVTFSKNAAFSVDGYLLNELSDIEIIENSRN